MHSIIRTLKYIVIIMFGCLFVLLAFADWIYGGRVQPNLDAKYVPTAQSLMKNPLPTPSFIVSITPEPASKVDTFDGICVMVSPEKISASEHDVSEWSRIFINGQRIPRSDYGIMYMGFLTSASSSERTDFCFNPALDPGLHMIQIQVGTSINALLQPNSDLSYTWTYEIE